MKKELLVKVAFNSECFNKKSWEFTYKGNQVTIPDPVYAMLINVEDLVDLSYDFNWDQIREMNVRPVQTTP